MLLSSTYVLRRRLERSVVYAHPGYPEMPRSLGQKLREMRMELRLQINDVAAAVGVCETTIINWEHGEVVPSPNLLE